VSRPITASPWITLKQWKIRNRMHPRRRCCKIPKIQKSFLYFIAFSLDFYPFKAFITRFLYFLLMGISVSPTSTVEAVNAEM
jgi:hypothetical protein